MFISTLEQYKNAVEFLNKAADAYYKKDTPIMSDEQNMI